MNKIFLLLALVGFSGLTTSCASKKKVTTLRMEIEDLTNDLSASRFDTDECNKKLSDKDKSIERLKGEVVKQESELSLKKDQIGDLKDQILDLKKQREQQMTQVGDLTVLTKSANDNIGQTIKQLEQKDKYINLLQNAKSKADSINLALAINLKSVLKKGIDDDDIEVKVDKTVVFINLSDKMLYQSGSALLTSRANEVLEKIAQIVKSRPDFEVMVEGYTDNMPIKNSCMEDNWDLSVKRSTSVVRTLQRNYGIDPNRLIAAGRGEYNTLADNNTSEGRSTNRRTRIIILPKLNQFYDLLNPNLAEK